MSGLRNMSDFEWLYLWMHPFKVFALINLIWWHNRPFWMKIFRCLFFSHRHINWRYLVGRQNQRSAECISKDESSRAFCNVCYFTILNALKRTGYQSCVMYAIHIECFPLGFPLQDNSSKTVFTLQTGCSKQKCPKTNSYWNKMSVLSVSSEIANISNCM